MCPGAAQDSSVIQAHPDRCWCLCLDLCPALLELAGANTPDKVRLQHQPPTRGSGKTAPNSMKLIQPTTGYLFSLATLRQAFQPGGEEFDAKPKLKPGSPKAKKQREAVAQSCGSRQPAVPLARPPLFWVTQCGDSAREREPQEGEINVFGGGN